MSQNNDIPSTQELARKRTNWAYERTQMAGTRTYFALLRTGLAIAGGGALVVAILGEDWADWIIGLLDGIFIIIGFSIILGALWRYRKLSKRLALEDKDLEPISIGLVVALTVMLQITIVVVLILYLFG
jgi:putative membrane protein